MCWICLRTVMSNTKILAWTSYVSYSVPVGPDRPMSVLYDFEGRERGERGERERERQRKYVLVMPNSNNQYTTNTGQKTGTLKISHHEQQNAITTALVAAYQNLNSGRRRIKGRNSSSCLLGSVGSFELSPSSRPSSWVREGSNLGWRKARKRFKR